MLLKDSSLTLRLAMRPTHSPLQSDERRSLLVNMPSRHGFYGDSPYREGLRAGEPRRLNTSVEVPNPSRAQGDRVLRAEESQIPHGSHRPTDDVSGCDVSPAHVKARADALARALDSSAKSQSSSSSSPTTPRSTEGNPRLSPTGQAYTGRQDTSVREENTGHSGGSSPTTLSIFNAPTATYMWPAFQLASQMKGNPVIYVNYRTDRSSQSTSITSLEEYNEDPNKLDDREPQCAQQSPESESCVPQKRRPSAQSADLRSLCNTSVRGIIEPMKQVHISETRGFEPTRAGYPQEELDGRPGTTAKALSEYSRHESESPPSCASETASSGTDNAIATDEQASSNEAKTSEDVDWHRYTRQEKDMDDRVFWRCTWIPKEGTSTPCQYTGKKQLMKRHIETTHLKFKPFTCNVCGKSFPQKTSLDTHMHGHTGATPHTCRFNCGKSFKDPARRHRHMVEEHGYVPRQSSKQRYRAQRLKVKEVNSTYESMRPWLL